MNVQVIDQEFLGTQEAIASFLIQGSDGYLLIETGPATTQTVLEKKITDLGVALSEVKHVLVSHIHLDHSGGAGYWAARGAKVYVHPKGARHLINPEKLLASAQRIYLDQMETLWGKTLPVPAEQVVELCDQTVTLSGLEVTALDTPGHASHHLAFKIGEALFTGDVAGCRLPGSEFVSVPGPPPEFHLQTWRESLDKLEPLKVENLYLTHFGKVSKPADHFFQLRKRLTACVDFVGRHLGLPPEELAARYQAWDAEQAKEFGVDEETYKAYERANPSFMSAQGIARYYKKYVLEA